MRIGAIAVVLLVAGCGGGGTPVATPAPTRTVTVTSTPEPLPTIVGTATNFSLPDGNIACELQPAYARCDIRARAWTAPRKPADCHNNWGTEVEFSVGTKGSFLCWFPPSPLGAKRVLPYGQAIQVGLVTCRASRTGVECSAEGHGIALGRSSYRVF